ncbi:MAG TPA: folylpolyglutamate synthase/dihydrofolate synthase family protein [Terriglobales bacterium]|nr:folylpolyglutamate synthase/dihydrofolate synthase family protein [Terriglobales bacterium]
MAPSYQSAVEQLYELGHELASTPSHKFDLAHMRVLLRALGDPQRNFRSVLIAGTNGKGSTAATLASILQAAGHRTGLYTSPHLMRVNERIRVDGKEITEPDFALSHDRTEHLANWLVSRGELPWHPSFFEMLTAMTFEHFARSGIEIGVLEVGMGGRLDATNVVEPLVSLITDISLDHQKFLGNTIAEIAAEKAGIIHEGGLVVTLPQHPQANDVIGRVVLERNATAVNAACYVPPVTPGVAGTVWDPRRQAEHWARSRYPLQVMGKEITVDSPLVGRHQLRNLALAIAAAEELNRLGISISPDAIERGIRETRWPGRFQVIPPSSGLPEMVFDVAHNPAGAWALRAALSERFEGRRITLLFGVLRDKAVGEIAEILFPLAEQVIATGVDNPRSASPEEIWDAAAKTGAEVATEPEFGKAMELAAKTATTSGLLVATGSIYLVGAALQWLKSR